MYESVDVVLGDGFRYSLSTLNVNILQSEISVRLSKKEGLIGK